MTSRLDELNTIFLLCVIFIMCTWDFCFIKPCQCLYHLVDYSMIFSGKITCNVKICREKNVKFTNWRHPYFSHFCWMVWGAGKFAVKTARVYRVKACRWLFLSVSAWRLASIIFHASRFSATAHASSSAHHPCFLLLGVPPFPTFYHTARPPPQRIHHCTASTYSPSTVCFSTSSSSNFLLTISLY